MGRKAVANSHWPASSGSSQASNTSAGRALNRRVIRIDACGGAIDRDGLPRPRLIRDFMLDFHRLRLVHHSRSAISEFDNPARAA